MSKEIKYTKNLTKYDVHDKLDKCFEPRWLSFKTNYRFHYDDNVYNSKTYDTRNINTLLLKQHNQHNQHNLHNQHNQYNHHNQHKFKSRKLYRLLRSYKITNTYNTLWFVVLHCEDIKTTYVRCNIKNKHQNTSFGYDMDACITHLLSYYHVPNCKNCGKSTTSINLIKYLRKFHITLLISDKGEIRLKTPRCFIVQRICEDFLLRLCCSSCCSIKRSCPIISYRTNNGFRFYVKEKVMILYRGIHDENSIYSLIPRDMINYLITLLCEISQL